MVRTRPTLLAMAAVTCVMFSSLWLIGGCSRAAKARPGMLARIEEKLAVTRAPQPARRIADAAPRCLKDRLSGAALRDEVARVEQSLNTKAASGNFVPGIPLSKFSPNQSVYLSKLSKFVNTDDMDLSSCADAPCIINTLYGTPNSDKGYAHYLWFLKTGMILSMTDEFPPMSLMEDGQLVEEIWKFSSVKDLRKFYFTDKELDYFKFVSYAAPPKYRTLGFQSVHKVPPGSYPPDWLDLVGKVKTCATSYGGRGNGDLRLAEDCLYGDFSGEGDLTILHELTHTLDRRLSGELKDDNKLYLSLGDEWMAFSGWKKLFSTKGGVTSFEWTHELPGKDYDDFVRTWDENPKPYAATSAIEDFAETASYARFQPDLAAKYSPHKLAYVSKKLFEGRTYDSAGRSSYYTSYAAQRASDAALTIVADCVSGKSPVAVAANGPHFQLSTALDAGKAACIEQGISAKISEALDELRGAEYEACDDLAKSEADLRAGIFKALGADVQAYVLKQNALAPILEATQELERALMKNVRFKDAFANCQSEKDPQVCFTGAVSDAFDDTAKPYLGTLGDALPREKTAFLSAHGYADTEKAVAELFRELFSGVNVYLEDAADSRWKACLQQGTPVPSPLPAGGAPDSLSDVVTEPFTGGATFVDAGILNCVNASALKDVHLARDQFLGDFMSSSNVAVLAYMDKLLVPIYLARLSDHLSKSAALEATEREARRSGVIEVLVQRLTTDAAWAKDGNTPEKCEGVAQAAFDDYFGRVTEKLPTRFEAYEDIRLAWSQAACAKAVQSPAAINAAFHTNFSLSTQELEDFALAEADQVIAACGRAYPGIKDHATRRRCLLRQWDTIESKAMKDWAKSPRGVLLATHRSEVLRSLEANRGANQDAAKKRCDAWQPRHD